MRIGHLRPTSDQEHLLSDAPLHGEIMQALHVDVVDVVMGDNS